MKKIYLTLILFCLLSIIFIPSLARAGIVTCTDDCTMDKFIEMFSKIYEFIVKDLAAPLATIAVTIGAIMMMISAGNPNLMSQGKTIFWSGVIGLFLALGSYAIIKFILDAVGYTGKI